MNEYVAIGSKDKSWSFHNLFQGVRLQTFKESEEVTSIQFHPDGMILVVGLKSGVLKFYDIRDQKVIREIEEFKGNHEV